MPGEHARVVEVFVVLDDVRDEDIALICRLKKIQLDALRLEEVLHELLLLDVVRTTYAPFSLRWPALDQMFLLAFLHHPLCILRDLVILTAILMVSIALVTPATITFEEFV